MIFLGEFKYYQNEREYTKIAMHNQQQVNGKEELVYRAMKDKMASGLIT